MKPLTHGRAAAFSIALFTAAAPLARAGIIQNDIAYVRGDQSRALLGNGAGVITAVVDGGIDANHPALRGSVVQSQDFSNSNTTDDDKSDVGHGTGIAGLLVGHDKANHYYGLAPGAQLLNARVVNASNRSPNLWVGNGLFWALEQGAKVVNLSLGNPTSKPGREQLNLMVDYAVEHYGATITVAAGNENVSAVDYTPGGNFNGVTVGATGGSRFDHVTSFSNYAVGDVRSKPELVAPGQGVALATANWEAGAAYYNQGWGTSFAAPIVGGIATQLIGYGQDHHQSTDPLVIKAVMMAGASKVYHYDGSAWTVRHMQRRKDGNVVDQPLDEEQGAGRVDGVGAYNIYAHHTDATTALADWKLSSMREQETQTIKLGKLTAGQHLDATMDWYRHVDRTDGGPDGTDGSDTFFGTASLADFSLTLMRDGQKVLTSDTDQDNYENLSLTLPQDGTYSLVLYRYAGKGLKDEEYALAMRVLNAVGKARSSRARARAAAITAASRLAKPDLKTLASLGSLKGGDLTDAGTLAIPDLATAVPEPTTLTPLAVALILLSRRRRRAII